jgi:hypothetical protein
MRFVDDPSGLAEVIRLVDQIASDPFQPPPFDQDHPDGLPSTGSSRLPTRTTESSTSADTRSSTESDQRTRP